MDYFPWEFLISWIILDKTNSHYAYLYSSLLNISFFKVITPLIHRIVNILWISGACFLPSYPSLATAFTESSCTNVFLFVYNQNWSIIEREILQKFQYGMSQSDIALGLHISHNINAKVVAPYQSCNIMNEMSNINITTNQYVNPLYSYVP